MRILLLSLGAFIGIYLLIDFFEKIGDFIDHQAVASDYLVEKVIYAETQKELTASCKALDRVLWYGYYLVPNWYVAKHRVTYWNIFAKPDKLPLYYTPMQLLMTWWAPNGGPDAGN